jgi:histone-lysine N-methyltransferase NSD1
MSHLVLYRHAPPDLLERSILVPQNRPSAEKLKLREGKKKLPMKKKSKPELTKEREDECFSCGDAGQIVSCKKPGCPKVYHADCLNLAKRPAGE